MKEYFVEKPMPHLGKDMYSCIPIPNEIVAEIRADAIDEFIDKFIKRNQFKQMNKCECINAMYVLAEQLREQNIK